ncbi:MULTISPECIES: DUF2487 family protein [Exiguobacterium]|uniref:DUF2487 domain-containing protein n=1 Tax=Exiguobacterium oxidotolerans TaxID=223958 RepID=A0A653ID95_9BACL|nr:MULTISPECIES: DUF2487 family protein [Exiguobacterium]ASI35657.1 hypothetical protein A0126_08810 [Exiguobacterium sp. N4-1P]VWX37016.1 conserved hypothetical protein [Exiguobacterium oxidotolerans]
MRFKPSDVQRTRNEQAYIDTLVVPLIPIGFDESMHAFAECADMTLTVASEVERQLSGRAMLLPAMTYVGIPSLDQLNGWREAASAEQFRFVTFITADLRWKDTAVDDIVYVPRLSLETMSRDQQGQMVGNFVGQVLEQLGNRWTAL